MITIIFCKIIKIKLIKVLKNNKYQNNKIDCMKKLLIAITLLMLILLLSLAYISSQQIQPANTGSVPITELFCTRVVDCEKYGDMINKSVNYTETNLNKVVGHKIKLIGFHSATKQTKRIE